MDRKEMSRRILDVTLEIVYLLTGEEYTVVRKTATPINHLQESEGWSPITDPPPLSLIQKILELTNKMAGLLTGELPIRCQDVAVYFTMEEWEYLEGHRNLYKDVMTDDHCDLYKDVTKEDHRPCTSPDGDRRRNPSKRCPLQLYSPDCRQEKGCVPLGHQVNGAMMENHLDLSKDVMENHLDLSEDVKENQLDLSEDIMEIHRDLSIDVITNNDRDLSEDIMMENHRLHTSPDGARRRNPPRSCSRPLYSQDCKENVPEKHQGADLTSHNAVVKAEEEGMSGEHSFVSKEEDEEVNIRGDHTYSCKEEDQEETMRIDHSGMSKENDQEETMRIDHPAMSKENDQEETMRIDHPGMSEEEDEYIPTAKPTSSKTLNRSLQVCKNCKKVIYCLSRHLRKRCMKNASEAAISQVVEEAKLNMRELVAHMSIISYNALDYSEGRFSNPRDFFVDFLEQRGCIIIHKPSERCPSDDVGEAARTSPSVTIRRKLVEAGIYRKHNLDSPLFDSFRQYSEKRLTKKSVRVMLQNLSRYLYFVNPDEISMEFLKDLGKTKKFITTYLSLTTSERTVREYLAHVHKFVKFVMSEDFPNDLDEDTKQTAKTFLEGLKKLKKVALEVRKGKTMPPKSEPLTPMDCRMVLTAEKTRISKLFAQADSGVELNDRDKLISCHYLQAVLVLKHLCNPRVPQNLLVKQWLQRKFKCSDGQKVAIITMAPYIIVLPYEDERLFDIYFKSIRPTQLVKNGKTVKHFLVSMRGQPVTNSSSDVGRLQKMFQVPLVRVKEARAVFDEWALINLSNQERDAVKSYVNGCNQKGEVAESTLIHGMFILTTLKGDKGENSRSLAVKRKRTEEGEEDEGNDAGELMRVKDELFKRLLEKCPIGLNQLIPPLKVCKQISQSHGHYCQGRWRRHQYKIRLDDVVSHLRHLPNYNQLAAYVKQQGWIMNIPSLNHVQEAWRPYKSRKVEDDLKYIDMVDSQEWRGLVMVEDREKGYAIKTTEVFKKGEIVCDYHGVLMEQREGEEIQKTLTNEKDFIYFFYEKGKKRCISSVEAPCSCHPHMPSTFGRLINHSSKRENVKPVVKYVRDGKTPVILFVAKEDIPPGTELLFNYGIRRS